MINTVRICEIQNEIQKVEREQEDAELCSKQLMHKNNDICDDLEDQLKLLRSEFEDCHGDSYLTGLVEEKYSLLLRAIRECDEFTADLEKERKDCNTKCSADIEALEQEIQRLEVMPI